MKITRRQLKRLISETLMIREDAMLEKEDIKKLVDDLIDTLKISVPDFVNRKVGFPTTGDNLKAANELLNLYKDNETVLNQIGMEFNRRSGFNKSQDPEKSLTALLDKMVNNPMIKKNRYDLNTYPAVKALYDANK
jgi:hypothetical protein